MTNVDLRPPRTTHIFKGVERWEDVGKKACLCLFLYCYVSELLGWIFVVFFLEPFFSTVFLFFCMSTSQLPPSGDGSVRKGVGLTLSLVPHVRVITDCKGFMSLHFTCVSQRHFLNGLWFKHNASVLEFL